VWRDFETNPTIRPDLVLCGQRGGSLQNDRAWLAKLSYNQIRTIQPGFGSFKSETDDGGIGSGRDDVIRLNGPSCE
jgi:hypothetical protein